MQSFHWSTLEINRFMNTINHHLKAFAIELQNRLNLAFEIVDIMKTTDYKEKKNFYKLDDKVLIFNQSLSLF